ncbi:unnamed protein product [Lota lota]
MDDVMRTTCLDNGVSKGSAAVLCSRGLETLEGQQPTAQPTMQAQPAAKRIWKDPFVVPIPPRMETRQN